MKTCKKGLHQYEGKRCPECKNSGMIAARKDNPEKFKVRNAAYHKANLGKIKTQKAAYRKSNPEKEKERVKAWHAANPEKCKVHRASYAVNNPEKGNAKAAGRRASKLQATPRWANKEKIEEFYFTADMLGMHTGEFYHVDHIVPLTSKKVCGLHCEANLQILTRKDNGVKGNRFWPDMAV